MTTAIVAIPLEDVAKVSMFGNLQSFADELMELKGNQFLKFSAEYDMEAKGKMNKGGRKGVPANPYFGIGLRKIATTSATVNFDYDGKVERRGGEEAATKGSWHTVCLLNGKVTPISVHKADILTELPGGLPDRLNNRRAVLDADGNVQFMTAEPRLYLRYEIVRAAGEGDRQGRQMRSESRYEDTDGNEIAKDDLKPWLPKREPRTDETDMQLTALGNLTELHAGGKVYRRLVAK